MRAATDRRLRVKLAGHRRPHSTGTRPADYAAKGTKQSAAPRSRPFHPKNFRGAMQDEVPIVARRRRFAAESWWSSQCRGTDIQLRAGDPRSARPRRYKILAHIRAASAHECTGTACKTIGECCPDRKSRRACTKRRPKFYYFFFFFFFVFFFFFFS